VLFSDPYLEFTQALVVSVARTAQIRSIADLRGQVVGIQAGNTSDIVARKLLAEGAIGRGPAGAPPTSDGCYMRGWSARATGCRVRVTPWQKRDDPR
jgi:hypothetical protein